MSKLKIKIFKQINNAYCAPATVKMILHFWGINKSQKFLAKLLGTTLDGGTKNDKNIIKCFQKFGFNVKFGTNGSWYILDKYVNNQKIPVIVWWFHEDCGHLSVACGLSKKSILLADPYSGKIIKMDWQKFNRIWFGFKGNFPKEKKIVSNWYLAAKPWKLK